MSKLACWMVPRNDYTNKMFCAYDYSDLDVVIIPFGLDSRDSVVNPAGLVRSNYPTGWLAILDSSFVYDRNGYMRMI